MNCQNHSTRNGVNTCSKCGNWLCEDCSIDVDGRNICKGCISQLVNANKTGAAHEARPKEEYIRHYERHIHHESCEKRRINRLLLLMFSFTIPGINYLFMGLMKRGVCAMTAFLLLSYCAGALNSPLIGIIAGIVYVVSIFDGFNVRRKLINHEFVEDGFSGIINTIYRHKLPLGILAFILLCTSGISKIANYAYYNTRFHNYYSYSRFNNFQDCSSVIFIIIAAAAVYYFFFKRGRKSKIDSADKEANYIDKTDRQ